MWNKKKDDAQRIACSPRCYGRKDEGLMQKWCKAPCIQTLQAERKPKERWQTVTHKGPTSVTGRPDWHGARATSLFEEATKQSLHLLGFVPETGPAVDSLLHHNRRLIPHGQDMQPGNQRGGLTAFMQPRWRSCTSSGINPSNGRRSGRYLLCCSSPQPSNAKLSHRSFWNINHNEALKVWSHRIRLSTFCF